MEKSKFKILIKPGDSKKAWANIIGYDKRFKGYRFFCGTGIEVNIPAKIMDKVFQPFFTTKPTGQGTGLGLSLSYDIIKAQGGEIKIETEQGQGTRFVIRL